MIQVIERVFKIMECLGPDKGVSLDELAETTALNKGTLCNILKTMTVLGYVEKAGTGSYRLGSKIQKLAEPFSKERTINAIGERYAGLLAEETEESGVVCTLRDERIHIIAQNRYERALMISPFSVYNNLSLYHSVSGRVLLAFLPGELLAMIIESAGLPGPEWENAETVSALEEKCMEIREAGMAVMLNVGMEIKAFAVPVCDRERRICASLGLTVPLHRIDEEREKGIVNALKMNAEKMEKALIRDNLSQNDFIKGI